MACIAGRVGYRHLFPRPPGCAACTPYYPSPSPPLAQVALWGAALVVFVFANFVKLQVG